MFSALQNLFNKFLPPLTLLSQLPVSTNALTFADVVTVGVIL